MNRSSSSLYLGQSSQCERWSCLLYVVKCCYNAVQFTTILHTSYGVSNMRILKKTAVHYNGTALYINRSIITMTSRHNGRDGVSITSLTIVYSTVNSDADQGKHQSSASLASVWAIHRGPVNSLHKWPVTAEKFPFHGVIMSYEH